MIVTSKERMLIAIRNGRPDCVPVAPDVSNMIPCRLTGKPFWDIYLYDAPPWWQAYVNAVKHFGFDGWRVASPVYCHGVHFNDHGRAVLADNYFDLLPGVPVTLARVDGRRSLPKLSAIAPKG